MLVAISFMDIQQYRKSQVFDRNEAIYVLHKVDNKTIDAIAEEFQLAIEEVQNIITTHTKYEAVLLGISE